jgi:hypothetical protein
LVDKEHILVHSEEIKDGRGVGATVLLAENVADRLQERNPVLGGACFCPRVHREQLSFHLGHGMLHHKVVDFLSVLVPPLLLIMCVVEISLPFCCLDKFGRVRWVVWEVDGRCLEFPHSQHSERTVKLEAVCYVFGDGFNIQIEGRCRLSGPSVVKNNMLQPLRGCRERWFLQGEGAALESRCSFNFWFLLGLGRFGSCHAIVDRRLIDKSGSVATTFLIKMLELKRSHQCCWYELRSRVQSNVVIADLN